MNGLEGGIAVFAWADLGRTTNAIDRAQSGDHVRDAVAQMVAETGFAWSAFIQLRAGRGKPTPLAQECTGHCAPMPDNQRCSDDPVWGRAEKSLMPFLWNEVDHAARSCAILRLVPILGKDAINRGGALPVHGPNGSISCLHVADRHPNPAFRQKFVDALSPLQVIAAAAAERMATLDDQCCTFTLSKRQRQVLRWTVAGKTNWEVGEILGICEDTVRQHMIHICRVLGAANRTHAVAIAVEHQLLTQADLLPAPEVIAAPPPSAHKAAISARR